MAALDPTLWAGAKGSGASGTPGERLVLGFDGSHCAGTEPRSSCGTADGFLYPVKIIERREKVEELARRLFVSSAPSTDSSTRYDVAWLYADPWRWSDELGRLGMTRWPGRVVELSDQQQTRMTPELVDCFRTALEEETITDNGDPDFDAARSECAAAEGRTRRGRTRPGCDREGRPGRSIDACVAAVRGDEASRSRVRCRSCSSRTRQTCNYPRGGVQSIHAPGKRTRLTVTIAPGLGSGAC